MLIAIILTLIFGFGNSQLNNTVEDEIKHSFPVVEQFDQIFNSSNYFPNCIEKECFSTINQFYCSGLCNTDLNAYINLINAMQNCYKGETCGINLDRMVLRNVQMPLDISQINGHCILHGDEVVIEGISDMKVNVTMDNQSKFDSPIYYNDITLNNRWSGLSITCSPNKVITKNIVKAEIKDVPVAKDEIKNVPVAKNVDIVTGAIGKAIQSTHLLDSVQSQLCAANDILVKNGILNLLFLICNDTSHVNARKIEDNRIVIENEFTSRVDITQTVFLSYFIFTRPANVNVVVGMSTGQNEYDDAIVRFLDPVPKNVQMELNNALVNIMASADFLNSFTLKIGDLYYALIKTASLTLCNNMCKLLNALSQQKQSNLI